MKNNLKKIRKEMGISQQQLADKAKLSRHTILAIENGKEPIKSDTIKKLVEATNTPANKIFFDFDVAFTKQKGK